MSTLEFIRRFTENPLSNISSRLPAVAVMEFGGGNCNKAGEPSCRDFCAVPNGKFYNSGLDPTPDMLMDQFRKIAALKPAVLSIVPNGEAVITNVKSNTSWSEVLHQQQKGVLSEKQASSLTEYYSRKYHSESVNCDQAMTPAEKMALVIAIAKNTGLNLSLTTNASFLNKDLIMLYKQMGLEYMNLSYHPNKPFDPHRYDLSLQHLIERANEAIEAGVIPTITHVLTRQNAETFVALADYVTEHDIFFAVGIANARGGHFSTGNESIEPTDEQVKTVFRRLLARKFYADRHIRTTIPYLLMAPFVRHWVCTQSTNFFHISMEETKGQLRPKLNVCSEVRTDNPIEVGSFLNKDGFDKDSYFDWRSRIMADPEAGCSGCTHQCYFESETRGTLSIGSNVEYWDWWDIFGKAVRLRHFSRHPLRPVVSQKRDFQNPYFWESLLQGIARIAAGLKNDEYWQHAFKRSGVDYEMLLADCVKDATNPFVINNLVKLEEQEEQVKIWQKQRLAATKRNQSFAIASNWHDAAYLQSRFLRAIYLPFQKSGKEAGIAVPLKFRQILDHELPEDFKATIAVIVERKRSEGINLKGILQFVKKVKSFLRFITNCYTITLTWYKIQSFQL